MRADIRFRAMGADVHVVVHGPAALAEQAREQIDHLEHLWSRFLPTSEVSALNHNTGHWVSVTPQTLELVGRALDGWAATGGRFDPTVLGDVVRAGYDRPFDQILTAGARDAAPTSPLHRSATGIELDRSEHAVRLPVGVGFDPGGIGKGLAADLVADRALADGAIGVLVNIGGDLRARGTAPGGEDWTVDIDLGLDLHAPTRVVLGEGALATSSTLRRRWRIGETPRHHLIDPTTGRPVARGPVAATVIAARGWQAEVLTKAALAASAGDGLAAISAAGAEGLVLDAAGVRRTTPGFDRFLAVGQHLRTVSA